MSITRTWVPGSCEQFIFYETKYFGNDTIEKTKWATCGAREQLWTSRVKNWCHFETSKKRIGMWDSKNNGSGEHFMIPTCPTIHASFSMGTILRQHEVSEVFAQSRSLTNTIITEAAVGGPGWPEDLACEAVLEFDDLTFDYDFLRTRRRSVCVWRTWGRNIYNGRTKW